MTDHQNQIMADYQHTTLEMDNNNISQEMENLTDKNDHLHELYPTSDIDDIDGRIPRIPKAGPRMGVDDGLLPTDEHGVIGNHHPVKPPSRRPSFAFPVSAPGFVNINGVETAIPDINAYQHKKTLAQGMMDLALLSANANQLRYVLESYQRHPYYYPSLVFISLSIIFQIAVGVGLILNSKYDVKDEKEICRANKINNYTVIGIFIITVVNVFISAFGVADPQSEKNT
ncbi:ninjurin-A isoform X2 [Calliphora vicina]|uniref:ninjurin-A isoform X2 n=1 Tax=Calliphora vicina TaxID=7373 RepID=UPI00325B7748